MLSGLSIRDIVLIDRLDLAFGSGLTVLTGETGAGKSILLDALGLALGARADSALVRQGADQAHVTAVFELGDDAVVRSVLAGADSGVDTGDGEPLILRRTLTGSGRSRAWINDVPVSVGLLRRVGDALIEIHGQFDTRGLLDPATHIRFLDAYAGHAGLQQQVREAYRAWDDARAALRRHGEAIAEARRQEGYLRHVRDELEALSTVAGEAARLADERAVLANAGQILEAMDRSLQLVGGEAGALATIGTAERGLSRVADRAGGRLDELIASLDRSAVELQEVEAGLIRLSDSIGGDPNRLETIDDRLHALRMAARKHQVEPDALPAVLERVVAQIDALDLDDARSSDLESSVETAREAYRSVAGRLSQGRRQAAEYLDRLVMAELSPLRLDQARFETGITTLDEAGWTQNGRDQVRFAVSTIPDTPAGPLDRVASGGELSRLLLALRVVLADAFALPTLVFDEVDAGVGGAVAAAVGQRLHLLGERLQVLVVTHSPQVAARGARHLRVVRMKTEAGAETNVQALDPAERREEVARMLSGAVITDAARHAADQLLESGQGSRDVTG